MAIQFPEKFEHIFTKQARFRVWYGGRGSAKSWSIARALLVLASSKPLRILCTRQYQISIADSSKRLLDDQIGLLGLSSFFDSTKTEIRGKNGSIFIFRGLQNINEIKSLEGVNICWVEEAEKISDESLDMLIPTIRAPDSQLWFSFNPYLKNDPMMSRFIYTTPPGAIVEKVNWHDNPWFPEVLKIEMEHDRATNYDRWLWVWEGQPRGLSDAQVFKGKFAVESFETPGDAEFYHGLDFGFAQDPNAAIRCFVQGSKLYIDMETGGLGIDIDDMPQMLGAIPTFVKWKSYADCARPETISYLNRHGFPMVKPVPKWQGSVEDGIEYLKSFEKIVVHPRCKHVIEELELYQYKQDRITSEVLPIIVDKNNHWMDALRYAVNDLIKNKKQVVFF